MSTVPTDLVPVTDSDEGWASTTWRVVRRSAVLIVAAALAGGLLAGLVTRAQSSTYSTSRTFVVQTSSGRGDTETLIRTVESLMLSKQTGQDSVDALHSDLLAGDMVAKLRISRPPSSGVLTITVRDSSPRRCRAIAASLSKVFERRLRSLLTARPGSLAPGFSVQAWGTPSRVVEVPPPTRRNVVIGILLGAVLATVGMVLRHQRYPVLRSPSHAVDAFGLPLIAALPALEEGARRGWNPFDAVEALLLRSPDTGSASRSDVLLVTGPASSDARVELILTLARVVAGTGAPVTLIDADVESGALTHRLHADNLPGVREALRENAPIALVPVDLDAQRVGDRLTGLVRLLPAGRGPSEQLTTTAARRLIGNPEPGTVVIVHGPPLPGRVPVAGLVKQATIVVVVAVETETLERDARAAGSLVQTLTAGNAGVVVLDSADPRVGTAGGVTDERWRQRRSAVELQGHAGPG